MPCGGECVGDILRLIALVEGDGEFKLFLANVALRFSRVSGIYLEVWLR